MSHDASVELQILATIDKWVEQELRPIAREYDQADEYPADLVEQMKELGLRHAGPEGTLPTQICFG